MELYRRHRLRLTQLAYRIVGQWNLAEDICSEAFICLLKNNPEDSAAWLTVVTTRLAYDEAKKSERLRTDYVGLWLPELVAVPADFDQFEEVNIALVRLLQILSPLDRAVVVLNEVAGYSLREIATALQLTPSAVRQRLIRARKKLQASRAISPVEQKEVERLAALLNQGNLESFVQALSEDVVLWTDAAGKAKAARRPIIGSDRVRRFLAGIFTKYGYPHFLVRDSIGGTLLVAESADMIRWVILETDGRGITGIQVQQNPDKRVDLVK